MNLSKTDILTYLRTDRAILVLCILTALIFWLTNKMSGNFQTEGEVAIQYDTPPGKAISNAPPKKVRVNYEGSGWDLFWKKKLNEILIEVPNRRTTHFSKDQIIAFVKDANIGSVNVDVLGQSYFDVILEDQATKKIPVVLQDEFNLVDQYFIKSIQIVPDSIDISGPATIINPIESWKTELLKIDDLKKSDESFVKLESYQEVEGKEVVSFSPNEIRVVYEVQQYTEKSLFIPISVLHGPDSLKIFPDKIKLNCKVSLNDYDKINYSDFKVEVNLKDVSPETDNNTIPVLLKSSPNNVSNISYSPKSVEFFFVQELDEGEE